MKKWFVSAPVFAVCIPSNNGFRYLFAPLRRIFKSWGGFCRCAFFGSHSEHSASGFVLIATIDCFAMKIQTGKGTMPLVVLLSIWSVSALSALPGLAVSPILGKLSVVFPRASELDIQMLTSLPSLLAVPFILLAGKMAEKTSELLLLRTGLWIFLLSGILYLLSEQMWQLVAVSALLGIGSGLIVPLSTGLVSRYFVGTYRTRQFGYSSSVTNLTLVLATALTGYLADISWRLPFVVYLFPAVSLALSVFLRDGTDSGGASVRNPQAATGPSSGFGRYGMDVRRLLGVMGFYGFVTYLVLVITFNLPFLMEEYGLDSERVGILISLFFLAIMAPGLVLGRIVRWQKRYTKLCSLAEIALGLALVVLSGSEAVMAAGVVLAGWGYGVIQPLVYDRASRLAVPRKATMALALVMVMNYVAILLCPFVIDGFQQLFHVRSQRFAFGLNLALTGMAVVVAWCMRRSSFFDDEVES